MSRPAWSIPGSVGVDQGAGEPMVTPTDAEARFEERAEIGSGGMGRVRLVRDVWLDRLIAVKEPVDERDRRRLWREALVTARLEHPGIVPVYDLGLGADGRPWFAMRVVRGRSLAEILREIRDDGRQAERLMRPLLAACEAIGYAHRRGVVHRDIKPANLMIGPFGEMQVIDWGLAQVEDLPNAELGSAGTRGYMSPEQERGEAVGPTSDVYSLGVVLREVTGGAGGEVPRELGAIIARCVEAEPTRRYADAKALAEDLEAYLDGRRVGAYEYSTFELVSRLARRWRVPLVAVGVSLVVLAVIVVIGVERVREERDQAEANLAISLVRESQRALVDDRLIDASVLASEALVKGARGRFGAEARGVLAAAGGALPGHAEVQVGLGEVLDLAEDFALTRRGDALVKVEAGAVGWSMAVGRDAVARAFDGGRLVGLATGPTVRVLEAGTGAVLWERDNPCASTWNMRLAEGGGGPSLLAWHRNCAARVTREGLWALPVDLCGEPTTHALAGHGDGRRVIAACGDGDLVTWDGERKRRFSAGLGTPSEPPLPTAIAFAGERVLVGSADGGVDAFELEAMGGETAMGEGMGRARKARIAQQSGLVRRLEVAPDGSKVVVLADASAAAVVDLERDAVLMRLPAMATRWARWGAEGALVTASATGDGGFRQARWSFGEDMRPRRLGFPDGVTRVAVTRDGRMAVGDGARVVMLDRSGVRTSEHRWQDSIIKTLAAGPSGRVVAHGQRTFDVFGYEGDLVVGRYRTPEVIFRRMVVLADDSIVASDYRHRRWRAWLEREPVELSPGEAIVDLVASADGHVIATLDQRGAIACAWDAVGAIAVEERCGELEGAVAIGVTGREVMALRPEGVVVFESGPGRATRESRRLEARGGELTSVAVHERLIAAGGRDGAVWVWGADGEVTILRQHGGRVDSLAFGPGEGWLVSGGWDGHLAFAQLDRGAPRAHEMRARFGLDLQSFFPLETLAGD